jgi:hypothetical protein
MANDAHHGQEGWMPPLPELLGRLRQLPRNLGVFVARA